MQPNPPLDLAAIEAALAKATPLPWCYDGGEMLMLPSPSKRHDPNGREGWCGEAASDNDGRLMVALANSAPALLAAAREAVRLREALEKYGRHSKEPWCSKWAGKFNVIDPDRPCDCGLESALRGEERA